MATRHLFTLFACLFIFSNGIFAQDRVFGYTYQSNVLNKTQKELEVWNTLRSGHANFYRALDTRAEFEIGLGSGLQTAFYLNFSNSTFFDPESGQISSTPVRLGFSNEWKWKLSDPVADPLGVALYGEVSVNPDETELETKIILDKQIGRTLHSLNLVAEPEWEAETEGGEVEQELEMTFEADYGLSVRLSPKWRLGFEARSLNLWNQGAWNRSSIFLGPGASFSMNGFWANLVLMPQVASSHLEHGIREHNLDLSEHERFEARLVFSFTL